MSVRVETAGLLSPTSLYKGMVSSGIHSQVASELHTHEKAHADADSERKGEFGFYVTGSWIVAYYLVKGERTPEQLMAIASAPGFSRMSQQDWEIYNNAWKDLLSQVKEETIKDSEDGERQKGEIIQYKDLRNKLTDILSEKFDILSEEGHFPKLDELLGSDFTDMVFKYGKWIYEAYNEAISEMKVCYYSQEK